VCPEEELQIDDRAKSYIPPVPVILFSDEVVQKFRGQYKIF